MFYSFSKCGCIGKCCCQVQRANYADWFKQIQFQLGVMDFDLTIVTNEKPAAVIETNTEAD